MANGLLLLVSTSLDFFGLGELYHWSLHVKLTQLASHQTCRTDHLNSRYYVTSSVETCHATDTVIRFAHQRRGRSALTCDGIFLSSLAIGRSVRVVFVQGNGQGDETRVSRTRLILSGFILR